MYTVLKQEGRAKRARLETVHGTIETPVFMNVGTAAAIKGAVATTDLHEIKTQVELSNTYHLHVRPRRPHCETTGRTAQIYELGPSDFNRFRRLSGIFSVKAEKNKRRGRVF